MYFLNSRPFIARPFQMLVFYSFLLTVGFILMLPFFLLKREKYASGFWQRMGFLPEFAPDDRRVVWIHCVSVGETNAARPLVEEIRKNYPEHRLIVSTTTRTGQELAREVFKEAAETVFYFPFDWKFSVRRALRRFRPDSILLVETEIWFRFLREADRVGAKTAIVNGRLSEKSFRNFARVGFLMRRVLAHLDLALMQTEDDARRIAALGIAPEKVRVTGNIKFDLALEAGESDVTRRFRERFDVSENAPPLVLAASTHAPEERLVLEAFRRASEKTGRDLRLMLAPRHPERFREVAELIGGSGFRWARRSMAPAASDRTAEIILLDSIGELRAAYALAEIVFVGGSLIPHGGQSVLEPAAAGKAIVTGPHTMNFAAVVKEFLGRKALIQLSATDEQSTVEELTGAFVRLLENVEERRAMADGALAAMRQSRGATAATVRSLRPFLEANR